MGSNDELIPVHIICGGQRHEANQINANSSIDQIHEQIQDLCGSFLPKFYQLQFYSPVLKKFLTLNINQLESVFNPFQINDQDSLCFMNFVEIYVVDTSDQMIGQNTSDETPWCKTKSIDLVYRLNGMIKETHCEQDLPKNNNTTANNSHHTKELSFALSGERGTSELIDANGNDDSKNAVPSESHGSNNYIDLAGDAESLEGDVSYDLQNTNSHQQSVQLLEDSNRISARIYFTHDVKPEQKNIYSSDKFNQKEQSKTNGSITCIQGIKNDSEAKRSIQPKLDIPEELRKIKNSCLLVYVVSEKYENGKRIWYKHRDKRFLPKDFERDTSPINPIKFDWQELVRTKKGDYILKLPMVTLWNKLQQEEILYALDEQSTKQLHLAEHNPSAPRLLCVIERDSNPCWKTMCLSDFIRSPASAKRTLTDATTTASTITAPSKRKKTS